MNKRRISLALAMLLLALVTLSAVAAVRGAYVYTSNGKTLRLRSGPGTDYSVIANIPYGTFVHINDYIDKTWVEVDYNDYHGYVMGRYLTYEKPGPSPQPGPKPTAKPHPGGNSLKYGYV